MRGYLSLLSVVALGAAGACVDGEDGETPDEVFASSEGGDDPSEGSGSGSGSGAGSGTGSGSGTGTGASSDSSADGGDDEADESNESGSGEGDDDDDEPPPPPPDCGEIEAKNYVWEDHLGETVQLHEYCESVTFISTGTLNCGPCDRKVLYALERHAELKDRGLETVLLYGPDIAEVPGPSNVGEKYEYFKEELASKGIDIEDLGVHFIPDPQDEFLFDYFPTAYSTSNTVVFRPGLEVEEKDASRDSSPSLHDATLDRLLEDYGG